jgi:hypothetical protein
VSPVRHRFRLGGRDLLIMRHRSSSTTSLRARVSVVAKLAVHETNAGPRYVQWWDLGEIWRTGARGPLPGDLAPLRPASVSEGEIIDRRDPLLCSPPLFKSSIAQHVACYASSDHILVQLIERRAIIVGDRGDVAFRHAHPGYLFVQHNGLVIADQRGVSLLSLAVDCPRLAFQQMGCKLAAPAGKLRCAFVASGDRQTLVPKNVSRIHRGLTKRGMIPR